MRKSATEAPIHRAAPAWNNDVGRHLPGTDLVARMLSAKDPDTGEPMSNEMIADNLATFLFAGHETTAKALTWALYILARAPEWQDRLREEISATSSARAPITAETVTQTAADCLAC